MKAIVYTHTGSPDVLQLKEVQKPILTDQQLLIHVHAASVNALDWHAIRRAPFFLRFVGWLLGGGRHTPKEQRLGVDLAGVVEAVGSKVTQFQVGDEVFGSGDGTFADYACARTDAVMLKPANLSFEAAAAVPVAALTALQGLRDTGQIQPGQQVLIQGQVGMWGSLRCRLPKPLGRKSPLCATRGMWTWCARLAQTTSLITPKKISRRLGSGMI